MNRLRKIAVLVILGLVFSGGVLRAEDAGEEEGLIKFLKSIRASFFIDTSYLYNFNNPQSGDNQLRVFDIDHNDFNVHLFELALEKTPTMEGGFANLIGGRVDLDFGEDADIFAAAGLGDTDDEFDLQQAFIHFLIPVENGIGVIFGKFVTLHGAEVIESKDNYNFSRSFLFGFAIPFTHTGARVHYPFSENADFYVGLNNGWDNVDDNNDGKTIETRLGFNFGVFSLGIAGIFGPEQDNRDGNWRELIDIVAILTPVERLTLVANLDFAWEQDVHFADFDGPDITKDVNWWGVAGYVVYDFTETVRLAIRGEFFRDDDGVRAAPATVLGVGQAIDLWEITPTLELRPFAKYKPLDNLVVRVEYRHDDADEDVFENDDGEFEDTQDTIAVEFMYYFSL